MATSTFPTILLLLIVPLLILPASSLKCTSQNFRGSPHYSHCADLPSLSSFLHWSYHPTNSTLSVAFVAPPAKPDGWIAWAINPTGEGMAGAQTLLAYKDSNGSMVVKTYNISSYSSIVESKLSFDVLDKKAEFSDGVMRIFATLVLPASLTTVNHIWQVGSTVTNGFPVKHEFNPENLSAKGKVEFARTVKPAGSPSHSPAPAPSPGSPVSASGPSIQTGTGPGNGASRRSSGWWLEFYCFSLLLGILVCGF